MIPSLPRRAAVVALVCLTAMLAACNRTPPAARDPESAANAFFAAVEKGDAQGAYDGAAFGFQTTQSFEAFMSNVQDLGFIGGQPPSWTTRKDLNDRSARLDGTVINASGNPINVSLTMSRDGAAWKLFSLKTAIGAQEAEDRFTMVGKGPGFNDVYHQPMPNQRQLDDLVHQTMARFNSAILAGDFREFYTHVSEEWKSGQRLSGDENSLVTPKMLKDHFQGFTDKKIDLSSVAVLPPIYDRPPLINQDGVLEVQGHFETLDYRANFSFQYVYELPFWKLFGMDVTLTR